jgi:hypothetical protein
MANWYGTSRSNYFKVENEEAFREWAESRDLEVFEGRGGLFGIAPSSMSEDGSWPSYDDEVDAGIDFQAELIEHLAEGQVAILMTIGAEKLRYLTGFSVALAWDGRRMSVDIADIYDKVELEFGLQPTAAEY